MRESMRGFLTLLTVLTLVTTPTWGQLASGGGRIEGLVVGLDGKPAEGYAVHLIDARGGAVAQARIDEGGSYSFDALAPGQYALGVEGPEGRVAPVDAPPVRLGERELTRRDLKLMNAGQWSGDQLVQRNYGLGTWWASLTPAAKSWSVVAMVAVVGITFALLDEDDPTASIFEPGTPAP